MSDKLIFNPFLQVHIDSEVETDFILSAPKPLDSLKIIKIRQDENPSLHRKISKYTNIGINLIDIDNELDSSEIDLFRDFGVLVEENNKPQKPLFSCQLDDVEVKHSEIDISNLIVNPTFRFEPFNLVNFKSWIDQKHFSPNQASVWIKNPVTKIESGYWLNQEQTAKLSNLKPNERIPIDLDEETLHKLISAEIFVTENSLKKTILEWQEIVKNAQQDFLDEKYVTIPNLIPPSQIEALKGFYKEYISQGFMLFGDNQVKKRFCEHNEPLSRYFHYNFAHLMSLIAQQDITPSYCFASSYKDEADLAPHRDREQCEFSISFQIDYAPLPEDKISPWALGISEPYILDDKYIAMTWEEFERQSANIKKSSYINMKCGEGLFYKGCEVIHYREKLPLGHTSTSHFFHYVPTDFKGKLR